MRAFSRTASPVRSPRQSVASQCSSTAPLCAAGTRASVFVASAPAPCCVAFGSVASASVASRSVASGTGASAFVASVSVASQSSSPRSSPRETVSVASRRVELPGRLASRVEPPGFQSSPPVQLSPALRQSRSLRSLRQLPRSVLGSAFQKLETTARDTLVERLSRRFGSHKDHKPVSLVVSRRFPVVSSGVEFSSVVSSGRRLQ